MSLARCLMASKYTVRGSYHHQKVAWCLLAVNQAVDGEQAGSLVNGHAPICIGLHFEKPEANLRVEKTEYFRVARCVHNCAVFALNLFYTIHEEPLRSIGQSHFAAGRTLQHFSEAYSTAILHLPNREPQFAEQSGWATVDPVGYQNRFQPVFVH